MFVTQDARHIAVEWREDLVNLIPHARELVFEGRRMLVIPNAHDEARVCRNVGIPVPAPIVTRYSWPHLPTKPPWATQKTTSALLTESGRAYVLSTMGTGKTAAAIWAADYLLQNDSAVQRVLIAAPLSTLTPVWEKELFELLPHARIRVLHGPRAKRVKLLAEDAEWYITNHHGLAMLKDDLVARGFGVVILDELAVFRNRATALWKAAATVVNGPATRYAWGMTGSPTPHAPTDAWAQIRMLTPERTTRTLTRFKDQTMRQVTTFKWIARPEATEIVHRQMQPSVRFTRDDVQELPETTYVDRAVKLEPEAAKAYKLLFDKMLMQTHRGETITAVNEGVLQNKLLQVACGYIYTDAHKVYELPHANRLKALEEALEETDRKVIVFVPYVHALQGITEHLVKAGETVALVHGGTSRSVRDRIFTDFQGAAEPRILVAHPQCMAHGLTLTAANTIVWYAPINSLEIYEQANARITRPGQNSKTLIVHLSGTPVEKATYSRLKERARMQGMLLELFHQQDVEY